MDVLAPLTDVHAEFLEYWSEQRQAASRIDRIYVSSPGLLLT